MQIMQNANVHIIKCWSRTSLTALEVINLLIICKAHVVQRSNTAANRREMMVQSVCIFLLFTKPHILWEAGFYRFYKFYIFLYR